ncbi:acyloxyacyl hydrolase [Desulfonatronum sp. SC1]|uniref:acyloxyacyl hydrolase n=1 Tax=Desulfonatronum sp. SC1 TaxID=2109626 RepID=UPI000D31AE4A|nr:acyloxyacyl hydrolase [Desulfonatronum sp. SC1]PTN38099.1 acyloxyacyl hydrolase [Desulfonatronum sp. SC1]
MGRLSWLVRDPRPWFWMKAALAVVAVAVLLLGASVLTARAGSSALAGDDHAPRLTPRMGLGLGYGLAYDPGDAKNFALVTGFMLFDYEDIWPHAAPEPLRFKIEAGLGGTTEGSSRGLASVSGLALYYLDGLGGSLFRPYGEAGVGVMYSGHKVPGQGSRLNFNPQIGIGAEFPGQGQSRIWASLRLHHLSNAGLHKDNRGVNSLVLMVGSYFD